MRNLIKVAACVPELKLADIEHNKNKIIDSIEKYDADVLVFPELSLTGYTCQDLFLNAGFIKNAMNATKQIAHTVLNKIVVIGVPILYKNNLYNCAVFMHDRKIIGIVPKVYTYKGMDCDDSRWFSDGADFEYENIVFDGECIPFRKELIFEDKNSDLKIAAVIGEDLLAPVSYSSTLAINGANIILNLAASNEILDKNIKRKTLLKAQSEKCKCAYVYVSAGTYESSSEKVYTGETIMASNGKLVESHTQFKHKESYSEALIDLDIIINKRLKTKMKNDYSICTHTIELCGNAREYTAEMLDKTPFVLKAARRIIQVNSIIELQSLALQRRILSTGIDKLVLGVSGGLDSTLALIVCCHALEALNLPSKNLIGITMPCYGTTNRTKDNSIKLMELFGTTIYEIDIKAAVDQHLKDIGHDENLFDITFENAQARERTQILFDMANKYNGLVIGTGDMSEFALGWCTYNGDHMSNYAVNGNIPKTLLKEMLKVYADKYTYGNEKLKAVLYNILGTPISPELLPIGEDGTIVQTTEGTIGKYDIHDFCLYHYVGNGFSEEKVFKLAKIAFEENVSEEEIEKTVKTFFRRFKTQQFKRSCQPDGPKVLDISLDPKNGWKMPSDF